MGAGPKSVGRLEGLPVSVPLAWDELDPRHPPWWDVRSVPRRLATLRTDPWSGYPRCRQGLSRALLQAVGGVSTVAPGGAAMRTLLVILITIATARSVGVARAEEPAERGGRIETEEAVVEILHPHHGRVIETPEGFLRVEDGPDLDRSPGLGSFATYHASAEPADVVAERSTPGGAPTVAPDGTPLRRDGLVDTTAPVPGADPCRAQRSRYMKRLLEMSGVKVDRPLDLIDGLAGPWGEGANVLWTGYVTPGVDPLKPLAWDQELRSLGRDLAACQGRATAARP